MQKSDRPRQELARALSALDGMRGAESFEQFEERWREFLRRLDRVWNKTEAHYSRSPKWHSWCGRYVQERTKDELLCYLAQARGVDEHTVADVVEHEPGSFSFRAGPGGSAHLRRVQLSGGKLSVEYSGAPPIVEFRASRAKLLPVTNRGRTYQPPTSHRGKEVDPENVMDVAQKAVVYYDELVGAAEGYFVK